MKLTFSWDMLLLNQFRGVQLHTMSSFWKFCVMVIYGIIWFWWYIPQPHESRIHLAFKKYGSDQSCQILSEVLPPTIVEMKYRIISNDF